MQAVWKLGSLEVWKLGGATEVEARAAALGGDEASRCATTTKNKGRLTPPRRTENGERRTGGVA